MERRSFFAAILALPGFLTGRGRRAPEDEWVTVTEMYFRGRDGGGHMVRFMGDPDAPLSDMEGGSMQMVIWPVEGGEEMWIGTADLPGQGNQSGKTYGCIHDMIDRFCVDEGGE